MDPSTHDVRRANWFNIITECRQRPVNVSVKQWLVDNDIKEKSYYVWLHKFRKEACEQVQLPTVATPAEVSFAEFQVRSSVIVRLGVADSSVAAVRTNGITLEESGDISESFLRILLQEVLHA